MIHGLFIIVFNTVVIALFLRQFQRLLGVFGALAIYLCEKKANEKYTFVVE